jgi:hypothetical protein
MRASFRFCAAAFCCTQSQRVTRATPSTSIVFHPVSSQIAHAGTPDPNAEMQISKCQTQNFIFDF